MAGKTVNINLKFASNGNLVINNLSVSLRDLQQNVVAAQKKVKETLLTVTSSFSAISVAAQGLSSSLSSLAGDYNSFDKAMRAANTMARKGADGFRQMKDEVKALSKEIPIARELLAEGLYQTISNGVPEDNWMDFLRDSARSSVGGLANLNEVVKVTSTVIKNYGYAWEDAASIQDKIQLTARNGVTSFEQLAQALPRVTGNAATLGVGIDELLASFSTLTGVSGNTAEVIEANRSDVLHLVFIVRIFSR